jgi:hypothetical protein
MSAKPFPEGLLSWAGHRDGGVRKPFVDNSGRPTGEIIRTRLLDRIDSWIDGLVQSDDFGHRVLLMVGGPGNGKTEAVEYFIGKFDKELHAFGMLVKKCKEAFTPPPGAHLSRKISISLRDIPDAEKFNIRRLEIVQDATVADPGMPGKSPEKLLIDDLEKTNNDSETIYILCVNRGILSQAIDEVTRSSSHNYTKNMLTKILSAVTLSPEQTNCWPLDGYPHVAVWPMDIESLVDHSIYNDGFTPLYQILKRVLDHSLWVPPEECPAGKLCPFHTNLEILSNENVLESLINILRYYEISSGKRWTFRDLFSLIPHLLVGHESDFTVQGKKVDPCNWAANHVKTYETSHDTYERTKSIFLLSSKIYSHALFPRWPDLRRVRNDCKQVLRRDPSNNANVNDLFRLLRWIKKDEITEIHGLIRGDVGTLLDPVEISGSVILSGDDISADNLEEMFSYSVEQGYSAIKEHISEIERAFMDWLVRVERKISDDASKGNKNHMRLYEKVRKSSRLFACRLVKRSLGVRKGITKEYQYLQRYGKAIEEEIELKKARKQFSELIHENSRFPISLTTTFGQPEPQREQDAIIYTPMVKVTYMMPPQSGKHARSSLPYLKIKDHAIPLTFPLFRALVELDEGIMEASIPTDTLALIEGTRARMAGDIVRDIDGLDDAILSVGGARFSLMVHDGKIKVEEQA